MKTQNHSVILFQKSQINYKTMDLKNGIGMLAPVVESPLSDSMGAGFITLEVAGFFEWQVLYDEILYVVSGTLIITQDNKVQKGEKGDIFFLKNGAKITYGTESSTEFFYSIYPANWREIHGLS
jgi:ethanolamine utilization protein EutQ